MSHIIENEIFHFSFMIIKLTMNLDIAQTRVFLEYKYDVMSDDMIPKDIPIDVINTCMKYGVIAGGFVISLLMPEYKPSDIDVFILNNSRDNVESLIKELSLKFNDISCEYISSIIQVHTKQLMYPIQIILTNHKRPEDITTSFDMDYTQCGIKIGDDDNLLIFKSHAATHALDSKQIKYLTLRAPIRRINKAIIKGFKVAEELKQLAENNDEERNINYSILNLTELSVIINNMKPLVKNNEYFDPKSTLMSKKEFLLNNGKDYIISRFVYRPKDTNEMRVNLDKRINGSTGVLRTIYENIEKEKYETALILSFFENPNKYVILGILEYSSEYSIDDILSIIDNIFDNSNVFDTPELTYECATSNIKIYIPESEYNEKETFINCNKDDLSEMEYFKNLFMSNMKESQTNIITINDTYSDVIYLLLNFNKLKDKSQLLEFSYNHICMLHKLSDRLVYIELKLICRDILIRFLNKATFKDLVSYMFLLNDKEIMHAVNIFVNDNIDFARSLIKHLDIDEFDFLLNNIERNYSKLFLMLSKSPYKYKDKIIYLIRDDPQVLRINGKKIIDEIVASKDIDILTLSLQIISKPLDSIINYPNYWKIVSLDNFDVNKLRLSSPYQFSMHSNINIKKMSLLYDNCLDWKLKLPKVSFTGFLSDKVSERNICTYRLNESLESHLKLINIFNQLKAFVIKSIEPYISDLKLNRFTQNGCIYDQVINNIFTQTETGAKIYIKLNKNIIIRDYDYNNNSQKSLEDYRPRQYPYIMHNGLLTINEIFCCAQKLYFGKYLSYCCVETPNNFTTDN